MVLVGRKLATGMPLVGWRKVRPAEIRDFLLSGLAARLCSPVVAAMLISRPAGGGRETTAAGLALAG